MLHKFKKILLKIFFTQSDAEPCLFFKAVENYLVLMVIHVDDCYVIGKVDAISKIAKDIEAEGLKLKLEYNTNDYLSFEIKFNKRKTCA
jgi:hypothetical protein